MDLKQSFESRMETTKERLEKLRVQDVRKSVSVAINNRQKKRRWGKPKKNGSSILFNITGSIQSRK